MLKEVRIPVGTVPIYQTGLRMARKSAVVDMDEDDIFNGIEQHAKDGVDFMTVHCGITKETVQTAARTRTASPTWSPAAARSWWPGSCTTSKENPLYEQFDYLLEMARKYEFTISLGDGLRPGCMHDASDGAQIHELIDPWASW